MQSTPVGARSVVYQPNQRQQGSILGSYVTLWQELWAYRYLVWHLFRRDFLMQYRNSLLGYGWLVLVPLFTMVTWVLMQLSGVLKPGSLGVPYPVFVLVGISYWQVFMAMVNNITMSLYTGADFIGQVGFPRHVLIFKQGLAAFVNGAISQLIVLLLLPLFGTWPTLWLMAYPLWVLPLFLLGAAFGVLCSLFAAFLADFRQLIVIFMQPLLFITPIVYRLDAAEGLLVTINRYNPLNVFINLPRDLILTGQTQAWEPFSIWLAICAVLFLVSMRFFYVAEEKIIERIVK